MSAFKKTEAALRHAHKETPRRAAYDYLTSILNRRSFLDKLQLEIGRLKSDGSPMGLFLMDIDYFKRINDCRGHRVGDMVLRHFACAVAELLRPGDIFGRYGGDEFILCLPATEYRETCEFAERLRAYIENAELTGNFGPVTVSVGVACCDYESFAGADDLIQKIDSCLYKAKERRNIIFGQDDSCGSPSP